MYKIPLANGLDLKPKIIKGQILGLVVVFKNIAYRKTGFKNYSKFAD